MEKEERIKRIIARGEVSDHCHVLVGECEVSDNIVKITGKCAIRHLIESAWTESGVETWTKEHKDIPLEIGEYNIVQQQEFDPLEKLTRKVID
ncbi:MAG: hypothetical protein PHS93_09635 [Candidatus Omnitrophica bacterium]|nr:hypothetical protein [Candidatus Omnitrophota bacterium]MDD5353409.1 hypothetical protein [Candidatus Omnitrophota bacterium]MDD5551378.1 hypothetical protein [Candidatus Omnitrophota bacterium]